MGAELFAIQLCGPARLSKSKALRAKAVKAIQKYLDTGDRHETVFDADDGELLQDAELDAVRFRKEWRTDTAEQVFDQFLELWKTGGGVYRDVSMRMCRPPAALKGSWCMVCAAFESWGDDSGKGWGFKILEAADVAGILKLYGIW